MLRRRKLIAGALSSLACGLLPGAASAAPLQRIIAASGEAIPAIGLGTWQQFDVGPESPGYARAQLALQRFVELGGRVVDSSPMYGASSETLGAMARASGIADRLFYASKLWTRGYASGRKQLLGELKRFAVPRMDLMQVHNLSDVSTQLNVLRDARERGEVRLIGVSHYLSSAHQEVERVIKHEGIDMVQINFSIIEPEAETRLLDIAQERGVAVMVNRVFVEGGLFRRVRGVELPAFVAPLGIQSWAQYFLKWVLAMPQVTVALVGTDNPEHVSDNLGALQGALPDQAMRKRMADFVRAL